MFCSRYFLHPNIADRISSFGCKYSTNRKQNIINRLNSENKYLYGNLLETRKQRRKSVGQESTKQSKLADGLEITKNSEDGSLNLEGRRKRGRKPKSIDLKTESPPENSIKNNEISTKNAMENISTIKSSFASLNSEDVISTSTEFVFKSKVPINDVNYPLENPAKISSRSNSASDAVLSYTLSDSIMKYCVSFPSVSKIIEETMSDKSKSILNKWQQNMINKLGQEGFGKYFEDLKSRGHDFHSAVCNKVLGKPTEVSSEVTQNALKSLEWMLQHVSNPLAVESITAHPLLEYKGIPDCIVHFRSIPVVVDWKLSDKAKRTLKDTYDAPVQITAYIGALNHDPNYKWRINHGLVAVAYTNGDPCDVFLLAPKHCQIYWRHWLERCDKFKARSHFHTDHVIDEKSL